MKCIVCANDSWQCLFSARDRMFGLPGKFFEYQCTTCGLVRLAPIPTSLKKYYPTKKYYSYQGKTRFSFFGFLRSFLITHKLLSFVPAMPEHKIGRILDIGCGSGDTLLLLKQIGWDTYGLDIDNQAVLIAKKNGLKNVITGGYESMSQFPDNYFDSIRLYHVIEHLDDPQRCFKLVYKKLKHAGEIIIGTPNINSIVARICKGYWYNLDCPRHLYLFTPKTLGALAKKSRFVRHKTTYSSAGGWVGSIQYMLEEITQRDIDLINRPWLIMFFYPLEWLLDRFGFGDVFVLRGEK